MKNKFEKTFLAFAFLLMANFVMAQAPQGIPYQAVARDNAGNLIKNQPIALRFSIHDGTANGAVVYSETHLVTTDALGLFAVNIGGGTSSGTFAKINWGSGAKFTQVELDVTGGSNYTDMGTTQMMSVPYALYAANANVPGVAGPQGATGAIGAQGPTGLTGSQGATGPAGLTGPQGPQGATGATGSVGSVTAISGTSNANGATISGGNLTLTPANATNGGIVTAGAQTFGGAKTFSNGIVGDLSGNATSATQTAVTASYSNSTFYPSFVNATSGTLDHYANSEFTFKPSTGNLTSRYFTGNLTGNVTGNATSATQTAVTPNSNASTFYPSFVSATYGTLDHYANSEFTFKPSTGNLTSRYFTGNLTGNVTGNVTGNASSASTASTATITTSTSGSPQYIPFVAGASGDQGLSSNNQLRFYPYTGELNATSFRGNLTGNVTGNASSASTATITTSTSGSPQYIPFVAGASGDQGLSSNNQLRFYPNAGELNATSFRGNLTGNVTGNATNLAGGAAGAIPYQSSAGTTSFTAAGTYGQVLTSNGTSSAPSWTTPSSSSSGTALETTPLSMCSSAYAPVVNQIYYSLIIPNSTFTPGNINLMTGSATPNASSFCKVGIYTTAGALIAYSTNGNNTSAGSALTAANTLYSIPLTLQATLTANTPYWIAFQFSGVLSTSFFSSSTASSNTPNVTGGNVASASTNSLPSTRLTATADTGMRFWMRIY